MKSISFNATNIGTGINNRLKQLLEAIKAQDHMYLEHYHQVCQMPNIWHLAHHTHTHTPKKKKKSHEMFLMSKYLTLINSALSNIEPYGQML